MTKETQDHNAEPDHDFYNDDSFYDEPESSATENNSDLVDKVKVLMDKMNNGERPKPLNPELSEDKKEGVNNKEATLVATPVPPPFKDASVDKGDNRKDAEKTSFKNTAANESVSEALGGAKERNKPNPPQAAALNEEVEAGLWQKTVALLTQMMEQLIRFFKNLFRRVTGKDPLESKDRYKDILEKEKEKEIDEQVSVENLTKILATGHGVEDKASNINLWSNAFQEGPEAVKALFNERLKANPNLDLNDQEAILREVLGDKLLAVPGMRDKIKELKLFEQFDNAENKEQEMKSEQVTQESASSEDNISNESLIQKLSENPNVDFTNVKSVFEALLGEEVMDMAEIQQMINEHQEEINYLKEGIQEVDPNIFKEGSLQLGPDDIKRLEQKLEKSIAENVPVNLLTETGIDVTQMAKQILLPSLTNLDWSELGDPEKRDTEIFDMMETESTYLSNSIQKGIEEIIAKSDPLLDEVLIEAGAQEIVSNLPSLGRHSFLDHKLVAEIGAFIIDKEQEALILLTYASMEVEDIAKERPEVAMRVQEEKELGLRTSAAALKKLEEDGSLPPSPAFS